MHKVIQIGDDAERIGMLRQKTPAELKLEKECKEERKKRGVPIWCCVVVGISIFALMSSAVTIFILFLLLLLLLLFMKKKVILLL